MSTMNNQEKLDALKAELAEIERKLAEVPGLEKRRRELCRGFHSLGEIEIARRKVRDEAFPVFKAAVIGWGRSERIVAVDAKWITIREDGDDEKKVRRFKADTGWKERARDNFNAIDAAEALRIWEEHQGKETP